TARVWDGETGREIAILSGHTEQVNRASLSPDGKLVVTGSNDHTARIWRVFSLTQDAVAYSISIAPRCLTPKQRSGFYMRPESSTWCTNSRRWPYDASSYIARAKEMIDNGDAQSALAESRRAVELAASGDDGKWTNGSAHLVRGQAFDMNGNVGSAAQDFEEAFRLGQDVSTYFLDKANRLLGLKDSTGAMAALDDAVAWASRDGIQHEARSRAFLARGKAHFVGDRKKALADFEQADLHHNEAAEFRVEVAEQWMAFGKLTEGMTELDEILIDASREGMHQVRSLAFLDRGKANFRAGYREKGLADFEQASWHRKEIAEYFEEAAKQLEASGKMNEAMVAWDNAVAWSSRKGVPLDVRLTIYNERGLRYYNIQD